MGVADKMFRSAVNDVFKGCDSFEVVRTIVLWAIVARIGFVLRKIHDKVGLKRWVEVLVMPYIRRIPAVKAKLDKELGKMRRDVEKSLFKDVGERTTRLPTEGKSGAELMALMQTRSELDCKYWAEGKVTGSVYHGGKEHMDMIGKVYAMFAYTNPLHSGLHPAVRQMDAEVVQMVVNMYNGDEHACGAFMTGGTE
eukprot:Hpha_TRINITY_DN16566_c1_g1::TRINITY_DN16566_c1_g1_i1::g.134512::m.134512/K01634/SGPL1, DPL1; sphinganine-1-phosphate aldolase